MGRPVGLELIAASRPMVGTRRVRPRHPSKAAKATDPEAEVSSSIKTNVDDKIEKMEEDPPFKGNSKDDPIKDEDLAESSHVARLRAIKMLKTPLSANAT